MRLGELMKNKRKNYWMIGGIAILLVSIIAAISVKGWQRFNNTPTNGKTEGAIVTEERDKSSGDNGIESEEGAAITLESLDQSRYGMATSPRFKVVSNKPLEVATLKKRLQFEPHREYNAKQLDNLSYLITVSEPYEHNSIVRATYTDKKDSMGWAFQTEKSFSVVATHPGNKGDYVPIDTGIEWTFSKEVLNKKAQDYITIQPHIDGRFEYLKDKVIFVPDMYLERNTEYTVTLKKGYGNGEEVLEEDHDFTFRTDNSVADVCIQLEGVSGDMTYIPTGKSQALECFLYGDTKEVDIQIYQYKSGTDYIKGYASRQSYTTREYIETLDASRLIRYKTEVRDGEHSDYIELQPLEEGYYYVTASVGKSIDGIYLQVTPYNGYTAVDREKFLVWMLDSRIGEPVEDAKIYVNGEAIGETDQQGFAMIQQELKSEEVAWVALQAGEDLPLYLPTYISKTPKNKGSYWSYLYADRGMYLPTDEIQLFGFVQKKKGKMPQRVTVKVERSEGHIIDEQEVALTDIGTYQTKFTLDNYLYGHLYVHTYVGDYKIDTLYLSVGRFEKPVFKIDSSLDKAYIMMGESVNYQAAVSYYEGTPAAYAKIQIGGSYLGINSSHQTCDVSGKLALTMSPKLDTTSWRPRFVDVNTTYRGLDKVYVSDRTGLMVFPRDIMVESKTKKTGDTSFDTYVDIHRIDLEGFQGKVYEEDQYRGKAIGEHSISIEIEERYYEKIYAGTGYDHISKTTHDIYGYKEHEQVVKTITGTTDQEGRFVFSFDDAVEGRSYSVRITTEDNSGRNITDSAYYSEGYQTYYNDYYYNVLVDKSRYKVNEDVKLTINQGFAPITADGGKVLYYVVSDEIMDYGITDKTSFTLPYLDKYIPYVNLRAVYFDGMAIHAMNYGTGMAYDYEDEELEVELDTNKESYKPGEYAKVKIRVKDKNQNPVEADVNINIVDEAFLAIYHDSPHALDRLYDVWHNYQDSLIGESVASYYREYDECMAEGGGALGGNYIRSDFKNTAYFQTIRTNDKGIGEATFVIPDNLTSWRIFATAIDKKIRAGNAEDNLSAKLPFFITTMLYDQYHVEDIIGITIKPGGEEIHEESEVTYTAIVDLQDGNQRKVSVKKQGLGYANLEIGQLPQGKHKVTVIGSYGALKDGVSYDIEVMASFHRFEMTDNYTLSKDTQITSNGQDVQLKFFNQEGYRYYRDLMNIYHKQYALRNDLLTAAYIAGNAINSYYQMDLAVDHILTKEFLDDSSLYRTFNYGDKSALTTAELIAIGYIRDEASLIEGFNLKAQGGSNSVEQIASLWGLTNLGEPVLLQLQSLYPQYMEKPVSLETLLLMEALLDIGDLEKGKKLYEKVEEHMARNKEAYYVAGFEYETKYTAMMMVGALKLGKLEDAKAMKMHLSKVVDHFYPTITEKLYYLQQTKPDKRKLSFTYKHEGREEAVTLNHLSPYTLNLSSKEADSLKLMHVDEGIHVEQTYIAKLDDIDKTDRYSISRWYTTESGGDRVKQGEIVEVHLQIDIEDPSIRRFRIDDVLPAGLTYLGYKRILPSRDSYVWIDDEVRQIHIYASCHQEKDTTDPISYEITYKARAITPGQYTSEPVVIQDRRYNEATYSGSNQIIIE